MEGLIEISELQPGMLVQFYKTWRCIESGLHCHPKMEKYFGQVVTVLGVYPNRGYFTIAEDVGEAPAQVDKSWVWPASMVESIVEELSFDPEDNSKFLDLIGGR